ncbi:GNAT family N-acetyltransferase [Amycolatopsis sp. K13G38]|uniref:GNAT family N-acetyltransferase n=1 Tax=Amycolatopsis acididurans TaxID=2724524 RepID=A0ABX1JDI0_9PSEU|nr:GNAT family N-acetyltransferase [Amycolatopsis acididurans]NKQ56506.1 GNAT family N-acetyltransferase [Amycolatopsis acididurans]
MELRVTPFDDPDSVKLIAEVQQEYVVRYGDQDKTPVEPAEFAPPHGLFLVGYAGGEPVACGGWRARQNPTGAEIKRMFVVNSARGKGFARQVLAELERTAARAGHRRMVLETGLNQPEAMALYQSSGYEKIPQFGVYKGTTLSVCFGKDVTPESAGA